ncbi:hypothetical protein RCH21_002514 [Arthrobacter sp. PL16]|uniref:hypothetical protein n=1 Tax=Arthrobacter sp. PL16 TaxID=3071720 RepID=UPI002E04D372|nr:hypothetical protein [Arthrobacter sp. PL16]
MRTPDGDDLDAAAVAVIADAGLAGVGPAGVVPVRRDLFGRLDWGSAVSITPDSSAGWDERAWRDSP